MRLLQRSTDGSLSFANHNNDVVPPYAILSHTWGNDDDEVIFEDVRNGSWKSKAAHAKLEFCAERVAADGLEHFWVDTCCINKMDASELSESLNSMYRWYRRAEKCYVYLADVAATTQDANNNTAAGLEDTVAASRWFTRGWTLQELLAPKVVDFWSCDGHFLGTRETLKSIITHVTEIPDAALCGAPPKDFSVDERFRWAAMRQTKRKEDIAYCMMGIFGVFMSPIYGEGEHNAIARLRRKISKTHIEYGGNAIAGTQATQSTTEQEKAQQKALEKLIEGLNFEQIDARHGSIKDAHRTTCEWLLQHPNFRHWQTRGVDTQHHGIFWIVGKPGAGKSTLMKFLLADARARGRQTDIVASFFFNAKGDELERTTCGLYHSLLVQLIKALPDECKRVDAITPSTTGYSPSTWTIDRLRNSLSSTVRMTGSRRIRLFIDALDECDERQVQDMIDSFEELELQTVDGSSRLDICFASRHYPTLMINHRWRLVLEDEAGHSNDLRMVIGQRLRLEGDAKTKGKLTSEIERQILGKANGIFLWAMLVVDILDKECRAGRVFAVERRLQEIPVGLSELFRDLLRRDQDNIADLLLCLQWILFAERPLRREEFYFAMEAGSKEHSSASWVPAPWDPDKPTTYHVDAFVSSSSKGLAELTKSEKAPTVQFIHESVRDYFIRDGGLQELGPELKGQVASFSHDRLKRCCEPYILLRSREHTLSHMSRYPFWRYATESMFHHANRAGAAVPTEVLQRFLDADFYSGMPSKRARSLDVWYGNNALLRALDRREWNIVVYLLDWEAGDVNVGGGEHGTALQLACKHSGPTSIIRKLLDKGAKVNARGAYYGTALQAACQKRDSDTVEVLLMAGTDVNAPGGYYGTALQVASTTSQELLAERLLKAGADPNAEGGRWAKPVFNRSYTRRGGDSEGDSDH